MKLNARDLKSTLHWNIITSVRKSSGQARAITMSARTSRRCCNTSSVSRVSHTRLWLRARRDLKVVAELGHIAVGLEGAAHFADMARACSGCEVWQQDFLKLDLPNNYFDGVFANAALFHVPSQELPRVLLELHASLKPGGVLFSSNPHGHNEEGWNGGRYVVYYDLNAWRRYVSAAGFVELSHYYRPAGLPRERQPWLASVWRR